MIFTKLTDIVEHFEKAYSHSVSSEARGYIHLSQNGRIRKPLSGTREAVRFSHSEKSLPLKINQAWLYNAINDAEGISQSLVYLQTHYEKAFNDLTASVLGQDNIQVEGKMISGNVEIRRTDLLQLEDLEAHINRLLSSARDELHGNHRKLVALLESDFQRRVDFRFDPNLPGGVYSDD